MEIVIKTFDELSIRELYQILQLRSEVFVVEQDCVYQDLDGKDEKAIHLLGIKEEKIVAYTRIFKAGDYFKNSSIGRVIVQQEQRKYGYGKLIMQASMDELYRQSPEQPIELSGQVYLLKFYKDLGFVPIGEEYLEDGIPHMRMVKKATS